MREHEGSGGRGGAGNSADYSRMDREVNDRSPTGFEATLWEDHSFLEATPRGGSRAALKMSTAFR